MVLIKQGLAMSVRVAVSLLLALLFWNVLLALLVFRPTSYRHDAALGWLPRGHVDTLDSTEGWEITKFNEYGFRDEEVAPRKPDEFRVLALGDSFTVGRQVQLQEVFTQRLQHDLAAKLGGKPVRVVNAGRDARHAEYYVGLAEPYQRIFQPDWVVILVPDLTWTCPLEPGRDSDFYLEPTGTGFKLHENWILERPKGFQKLVKKWQIPDPVVVEYTRYLERIRGKQRQSSKKGDPTSENSSAAQQARLIDWLVGKIRSAYPRVVLVHLPLGSPALHGLNPVSREETLVQAACKKYGVPLIPMRERIERDFAAHQIPPYGFANTLPWSGHINTRGHMLVAEALQEFFATRLRVASR